MLKLLLNILFNEQGGTLSLTRYTSNTLITAAAFNTNYTTLEGIVNELESTNLKDAAVTAAKLNADVIRTNYGLKQHTDGTLYVDVSDTNPALEISDGGLRAKVYGMINRTANGLTFGRTGDKILTSASTTPNGWTDQSATYSNKFIRINATPGSAGGSDTFSGTSGSHALTIAEMPAHTHNNTNVQANKYSGDSGDSWNTESGNIATSSTGGGGGHTHTISGDCVPSYTTLRMISKS